MEIYVDSKRAYLKKGTSFEYVSENRLFSGSDGYSLTITFPLRGCQQNLNIFGHINRDDVIAGKIIFDCEIRDRNFYKFGSITITEINESEVKTQFLEGRSEQNFDETFDKVYINELDLGSYSDFDGSTPAKAWGPLANDMKAVAIPWVNDASGNIQNLADYEPVTKTYSWNSETSGRSWQPYLLYITKRICEAVGYAYDFSKWEASVQFRYLLICNTLPYSWYMPELATALPHWTVEEYFEKLELFMNGEFDFDHRNRRITFDFSDTVVNSLTPVKIDKIINEHTVEVTVEEDKCDYIEAKNLVYKECDHQMWKFYSCDWFINSRSESSIVKYETMSELMSENRWLSSWNGSSQRGSYRDKVFYAKDIDTYFLIRALSKTLVKENSGWTPNIYSYKVELRPINMLGGRIVNSNDDAEEEEIEFVPACIDYTDDKYGRLLFLAFSSYEEKTSSTSTSSSNWQTAPEDNKAMVDATLYQPGAYQALAAGEKNKKSEYYDRIYIAWYAGIYNNESNGHLPHPCVEDIEVYSDWSRFSRYSFSLRLNSTTAIRSDSLPKIESKKKTTFKFLSDTIPNVRSIFYIQGKKYIAEKITATFTENGMSQLLKGVFYPIVD